MINKSYLLDTEDALNKERVRLTDQAQVFSKYEFNFFKSIISQESTVMDLGCGNGAYLSLLGNHFKVLNLFGYERNASLITEAKANFSNLNVIHGDLLDSKLLKSHIASIRPNILLIRFVFQHLNKLQRQSILNDIVDSVGHETTLLVIESEDSKIKTTENSEKLSDVVMHAGKVQADRGGNRNIGEIIAAELTSSGLLVIEENLIFLSTNISPPKELVPIITKIWRCYSSENEKLKIDSDVDEVEKWLYRKIENCNYEFKFPIKLVIAKKIK